MVAKQNVNSYMEIPIIIALILLNGIFAMSEMPRSQRVKVVCPMDIRMEALQRVLL